MSIILLLGLIVLIREDLCIIITIAGTGSTGYNGDGLVATSAQLNYPFGLFKDNKWIWLADNNNHRIRRIDIITTNITTFAGIGSNGFDRDGGLATNSMLNSPDYITVYGFNAFISDYGNHRIRQVNMNTGIINTVVGISGYGYNGDNILANNSQLNRPACVIVNDNYMYISDHNNHRVRVINLITQIITTFAGTGNYSYNGAGGPSTSYNIPYPFGLFETSSYLYISSVNAGAVYRVSLSNQQMVVVVGNGINYNSGDGSQATSAQLNYPYYLHILKDNIWICDSNNQRVRLVKLSTGIITTFVGTGTSGFSGDGGPPTSAQLRFPNGITGDSQYIWITDSNQRIRRISIDRRSSILGDPHFIGLSGGKYTIDLQPNHCYVIFSSSRFHWNSCAIQLGHRSVSYLGSMGFWLDNISIQLPHVIKPPLCVIINQKQTICPIPPLLNLYYYLKLKSDGLFQVRLFRNSMILKTPCLRLRIDLHSRRHSIKEGNHQYYSRREMHSHFNAIIISSPSITDPSSSSSSLFCSKSHGLLGITMNKPAIAKGKNGEGVLEGHLEDYEVNNVLDTHFKYSRFDK
eukprot:NODE_662_length_2492_cov_26.902068_g567_i0.p1 GENE.NODE_662_length_2492_cov_26.902068_g567_i0~~NODE_662_length_2492_cov_26.902068_g567_i0.p1  ORF type:complete len:577 (+),score=126.27 NODE_662_length_2492_cov_26.902068_g567_i0:75-1805(+)